MRLKPAFTHVPDKIVRQMLPMDKSLLSLLSPFRPDGITKINGKIWCFEYENSSRGLLSNVAKYMYLSEHRNLKLNVVLIESPFHVRAHKQDLLLAKYIATKAKNCKFIFKMH